MNAGKPEPKRPQPTGGEPIEWELISRNLNGLKTFHRMQRDLIDDLEKLIQRIRDRRPSGS
ncbi:MAG: hypothetical protein WD066_05085 [Planctomycetaceae bacterium]